MCYDDYKSNKYVLYDRLNINCKADYINLTFKLIFVKEGNNRGCLECALYCIEKKALVIWGSIYWVSNRFPDMNIINKEEVLKLGKEVWCDAVERFKIIFKK